MDYLLRVPEGMAADGAVIELAQEDDAAFVLTAVPRIPAPQED